MNKLIRASILAFALIAGFSPAFAQAPPPVPALPDAERRTSYVIAATTCICNVNFALYGDSTDYASWVEVYLNGVRVNFNDGTFGWTITSPTGALGSIPRPVTDAVLTFNGVQTGTVQIVGARRPRRTSTFAENRGVAARDLNQILNDMIAQNRETWDKTNDVTGRALLSQPGNTIGLLPLPAACAGKFLGFDVTGLIPQCSAGGAGSGNVVGPASSTVGHFAFFNNATGTLLSDGGAFAPLDHGGLGGDQSAATANQIPVYPGSGGAAVPRSASTWFDSAYCNTLGFLIVRFTSTWTCDNSIPGSVKWWGATGNGSTDDTTAIQNALTAMQAAGGSAYFPAGCYKVTTGLTNSGGIKLGGAGYQGDSGGGFAGSGVTSCTANVGSVITCAAAINCYTATTNQAVKIENLQFSYLSAASAGTSAITIKAVAGAGNANTQSSIRNVMVTGGDTGVTMTNALNFNFTDNFILYQITNGMVVNSPNFPSFQQASISNNVFWGAANAGYSDHLLVQAGGDLRIINNKFTTGGVNTNSIALFGASSGAQNMEPMVIAGNSSEGAQNCITFSTANASFTATQILITGNQLWCGGKSILVSAFGVSQWVIGLTVTGNVLTVNGGAGVNPVSIDNVKNATFTGNTFNCSGGCSASTGIALAAHTTGIVTGNNTFDVGYTTTVSNLAASGLNVINDIYCPPVVSVFTSGTNATFSPSTCAGNLPKYFEMEMVGGGGGGAGSGTTPGAATVGSPTCFSLSGTACSSPVYQAGGGALGTVTPGAPVAGGTVSGSGTCDDAIAGMGGATGSNQANSFGGYGGSSPYGGAGAAGFAVAGQAAAANSGSGGGGAGEASTANGGGGGSAGAFCRKLITSPAASYVYTIGPGGTGGTLGTGGAAGGNGAAGRLKTIQRWSFLLDHANDNLPIGISAAA